MFKEKEEEMVSRKKGEELKAQYKISVVPFPPQEIFHNIAKNVRSESEGFAKNANEAELKASIVSNVQRLQRLHDGSYSTADFKAKLAIIFLENVKSVV